MERRYEWTDAVDGIALTEVDRAYDVEMLEKGRVSMAASKVTLFVGANNVGKSRFMRTIARSKGLTIRSTQVGWRQDVRGAMREADEILSQLIDSSRQAFKVPLSQSEQYIINKEVHWSTQLTGVCNHCGNFVRQSWVKFEGVENPIPEGLFNEVLNVPPGRAQQIQGITERLNRLRSIAEEVRAHKPMNLPRRTYVPVLRSLRSIDRDGEAKRYTDVFGKATTSDYKLDGVGVETGLSIYDDLRQKLLGKRAEREAVRAYEEFLTRNFFEGRRVTLTPHEKDQALYVDLDGKEHPIHELGDGMQSVIVMTYKAFTTSDTPGMFFIEEPELFLHPGMQRRLVHFFLHETPHLYFITTHSNHLLELSMDERKITVLNFHHGKRTTPARPDAPEYVTRVRRVSGGDRSSLALLGVRVSSVFLVNASVWVEGVTDRRYLRELIRLYVEASQATAGFRRMEEDVHYSFVEYGGSNITHWSFMKHKDEEHPIDVRRLCAQGVLLIDADDSGVPGTSKHGRRDELQKSIGDRLFVTAGREVENMLPERVIHAVMKQYGEDDAACAKVLRTEYRDRLLGEYIDQQLGTNGKRKTWKGRSGTIADKVEFCERAIDAMRAADFKFADLPDEVKQIVKGIYDFILKMNKDGVAA